jgi:hypothetical protein
MKLSHLIIILQDTAEMKKRDGIEDPDVFVKVGAYLHYVEPQNQRDVDFVRLMAGESVGLDPAGFRGNRDEIWTD